MQENQSIQTIGKYRIVGTLGRGSMGVVYKGQDPEIGRIVAVKTLRRITSAHFNDAEAALERFKIEARSAGNLRHPNIITIFDVNVEGDTPYIVMDYVEGESLDVILSREERLDVGRTLAFLEQVAGGIDAAHAAGVIHRDIKPSNLIVDQSGSLFILDFGVAKINQSFNESEKVVRPEPVMGTPGYMSPEQILNEKLDARSDLFSLAIVAFELLTGRRPFDGSNFTEIVSNILNQKAPSLTSIAPELPLALEAEFEKALAKKRDNRFNSAGEMVKAFKRAAGLDGRAVPAVVEPEEDRPFRERKKSHWQSIGQSMGAGPSSEQSSDNGGGLSKMPNVPFTQTNIDKTIDANPWASDDTASRKLREEVARAEANRVGRGGGPTPGQLFEGPYDRPKNPEGFRTRRNTPSQILFGILGGVLVLMGIMLAYNYTQQPVQITVPVEAPKKQAVVSVQQGEDDSLFSKPDAAPIPEGKLVQEMADKELIGILLSTDVSDEMMLQALREASDRRVPKLVEAALYPLESDSYIVRIETIKLLASLGDKRVVGKLVEKLDDHDPLVRAHAANALGTLGSRAALSYLSRRCYLEQEGKVKKQILEALEKINGFPVKDC